MKKLAFVALAVLTIGANAFSAYANGMLTSSSDTTFRSDVLSSATPVVVDFYADWCGPCKRMTPVFDKLASQYNGKVKFVRVNIDESPQTAAKYGISSIPAFGVFKGGRLVDGVVGAVSEQNLSSVISRGSTK